MTGTSLRCISVFSLGFTATVLLGGCSGGEGAAPLISAGSNASNINNPLTGGSGSPPTPTATSPPAGAANTPAPFGAPRTSSTPTPRPAPVSSPAPIAAAGTFDGCSYFTDGTFTTDISNASLDPKSGAYIKATVDGGDTGSFNVWMPDDEYVNLANNSTPMVSVRPKVSWHTPTSTVPWASAFKISPLGDAHALVLQQQTCMYDELYDTTYSGGVLSAYNGGSWNLTQSYVRPQYGAISTASGIPLGILAVKPEDFAAGVIRHALGWGGVAHSLSYNACVSPAGVSNCTDGLSYNGPSTDTPMPYGAHIRLKASFNDSGFPREAYIVAEALKRYGAYLYDSGCCDEIPFTDDPHGSMSSIWTSADGSAIGTIKITDFDVVVPPN